jgi:prophage tail gpP-like protein
VIISTPKHTISVLVDGKEIRDWESYSIDTSMTTPVDSFRLRHVFSREVWDACREDRPVQICIDGTPVITGLIDDREAAEDEYAIDISGRCKVGRLYDDAADSISFAGLSLKDLIEQLAVPPFSRVVLDAARDRDLRRGKGKKARAVNGPIPIPTRGSTQIEIGQTRWSVIADLIEQAGLLARSSGDGKELIVAPPNYAQEIQFRFFRPAPDSKRPRESTVKAMSVKLSTADRYSRVIVVGSGAGTSVNFGSAVAARFGEARDNPFQLNGAGDDFTLPKRLVVQRSLQSTDEANELARREMAHRDAQGDIVTVMAAAHGQRIAGAFTTLFGCDLLASVEDERTGVTGTYLIESCAFEGNRSSQQTRMKLVRKNAELAPVGSG